jgi:single-strand DNA-binding protein
VSATTTIIGNVTRDPEQRFTGSGMAVTSFGVAVNERTKNESGEWVDGEASFYDVTCFRLLAESVAEVVGKGDRVIVTGKLKQSRWEKDGVQRSKIECVADDVAKSVLWAAKDNGPSAPSRPAPKVEYSDEPF